MLKKHMLIHTDQAQCCHYYKNGKLCPFDEIGCMFRHEDADQCRTRTCTRKLCQNKHELSNEEEATIEDVESDSEDQDYNFQPEKNQCHICRKQLHSDDDSWTTLEMNIFKECWIKNDSAVSHRPMVGLTG